MVAIGSYEPEIYKREEWELKQLREKTMKQNWENNLVEYDGVWYIKGKNGNCEKFIMSDLKKIIQGAKQEEREKIEKENTNVANMCSKLKLIAYKMVPRGQVWINKNDFDKSNK